MMNSFENEEDDHDDHDDHDHEYGDDYDDESDGNELKDNDADDEQNEDKQMKYELSQMSFEEILKLKDKLGTKIYGETFLGKNEANKLKKPRNESFKRANKNRPREESAKRPVTVFRHVYHVKKDEHSQRIDPRFDERCGKFNEKIFNKTYSFLDDIKDKEIIRLKKRLKKTNDENKRKDIQYLIKRMENQKKSKSEREIQMENEMRIKKSFVNDERPQFVNKSTIKRIELVDKYKRLKKSGKLSKYMEKKRKRNANRERKKINSKREY